MASPPVHVIGVDVGGTKIKAGLIAFDSDGTVRHLVRAEQIPTPHLEPSSFYDQLASVIQRLRATADREGMALAPVAAVAQPGRFLPDGTLARGTTPNLGTAPGQFDGLSPTRELERRLGMMVVAENDAVAQMRFGLDCLLRDPAVRPRLVRRLVVYLGPGTGMGGGVARIHGEGQVTPVTDGHLFDLRVANYGDGQQTAEELFTGPAIARAVEEANRQLARPIQPASGGSLDLILTARDSPAEHRAVATRLADQFGVILACLIELIHAGRIVKVRVERRSDGQLVRHVDEPDRAWSAQDTTQVTGVQRVVMGGFIGCSRGLGSRIRQAALAELRQRGLKTIELFQIPMDSGDAGLLGIARAIPLNQLNVVRKRAVDG